MGRGWALAAILFAGLMALVGFAAVLVPFLVDQISALVEEFPAFVERLQQTPGIVGWITQSIDVGSLATGSEGEAGSSPAALGLVSSLGVTLLNLVTILAVTLEAAGQPPSSVIGPCQPVGCRFDFWRRSTFIPVPHVVGSVRILGLTSNPA
jgi:hypothetical protein